MALMQWNSRLETGHSQIDKEHKVLVALINKLNDAMQAGNSKDVCGGVLHDLLQYTKTHFTMEQRLMGANRYKGEAEHKKLHDAFVHDVLEFKKKFDAGSTLISISLLHMLRDWLSSHIQHSDKDFVASLASSDKAVKSAA